MWRKRTGNLFHAISILSDIFLLIPRYKYTFSHVAKSISARRIYLSFIIEVQTLAIFPSSPKEGAREAEYLE
jgi:hypothetical protein